MKSLPVPFLGKIANNLKRAILISFPQLKIKMSSSVKNIASYFTKIILFTMTIDNN